MDTRDIRCPLTKEYIDEYSCYLICEAAEGMVPENEMPGIKKYEEEKEICIKCRYHNTD